MKAHSDDMIDHNVTHVDVQTDLNDWADNYAVEHYIHPHVISYFKQSGEYFNELDKTEPSKSDVGDEPTTTGK